MTNTGMRQFDSSIQKTLAWLEEVQDELVVDRQNAYLATKAVLSVLRDRMPASEAADLGDQLPMLMRGFYYEGFHPARAPSAIRSREEFDDAVSERLVAMFRPSPGERLRAEPRAVASAVLSMLSRHVSAGEVEDVLATLPSDIASVWREAAET